MERAKNAIVLTDDVINELEPLKSSGAAPTMQDPGAASPEFSLAVMSAPESNIICTTKSAHSKAGRLKDTAYLLIAKVVVLSKP